MRVARGPHQRPYARYPAQRTQSSTSMPQRRYLHFRLNLQWVWCNRTPPVIRHVSGGKSGDATAVVDVRRIDSQPRRMSPDPRLTVLASGVPGAWASNRASDSSGVGIS